MRQLIRQWHRRIGITTACFVIVLAFTGLLLNHTDTLNLKEKFIQNHFLLDWYNVKADIPMTGFTDAGHWSIQLGDRIYFNQVEIVDHVRSLVGMIKLSNDLIIAFDGQLWIIAPQGTIIEKLTSTEGVPAGMQAIGLNKLQQLIVKGAHGDYLADIETLTWREIKTFNSTWSTPQAIPKTLSDNLMQQYQGKWLSVERIIIDIHSGRIFSSVGILLVDAMAILFLLLAFSGIWMWYKS